MPLTLYYNPRCGTCQKVKAALEERGLKPRLVEYLKNPPTVQDLEDLLKKLKSGPEAITRFKEPVWEEKGLDPKTLPRKDWLALIAQNPVLLQRPILVTETRALVARPPETLDEFFKNA